MDSRTDSPLSFGIKTTPVHTTYDDLLRVWEEADTVPEIEHAWLWDHLMPLFGPKDGPAFEGWTLLAALAARTRRLRLGLLVTSNRIRPPAVLAKIAATTDVISGGRLVVGLGVGGTHQPAGAGGVPGDNPAIAEYAAYGLDLVPPAEGVARLAETCTVLRRMWTEDVVDFDGPHVTLRGARCEPRPVQRPGPPLLIGGWGDRTLGWSPGTPTCGTSPAPRTTRWGTSPSGCGSWTPTAPTSAGTRPRWCGRCRPTSATTTPPPPARPYGNWPRSASATSC